MIEVQENSSEDVLEINISQTLTGADLDHFVPVLKKHIAESTDPRLLIIMDDFTGWSDVAAFWKDISLDAEYIGQFSRVALVGKRKWVEWMTKVINPLTPNEQKFFGPEEATHARRWLENKA